MPRTAMALVIESPASFTAQPQAPAREVHNEKCEIVLSEKRV